MSRIKASLSKRTIEIPVANMLLDIFTGADSEHKEKQIVVRAEGEDIIIATRKGSAPWCGSRMSFDDFHELLEAHIQQRHSTVSPTNELLVTLAEKDRSKKPLFGLTKTEDGSYIVTRIIGKPDVKQLPVHENDKIVIAARPRMSQLLYGLTSLLDKIRRRERADD